MPDPSPKSLAEQEGVAVETCSRCGTTHQYPEHFPAEMRSCPSCAQRASQWASLPPDERKATPLDEFLKKAVVVDVTHAAKDAGRGKDGAK